jgi:hypothetical protein
VTDVAYTTQRRSFEEVVMADRFDDRRLDERERRERGRQYGPRSEQEWGDYPYRGETWRDGNPGSGWGSEGGRGEFEGLGPKGYQRSDARIQEDVCDRLTEAPDIDASDIEVKTANGEVTLSGSVRDRGQKRRAEDVIENLSGVREVHNNLRVSRPQENTTRTT